VFAQFNVVDALGADAEEELRRLLTKLLPAGGEAVTST
jgi:hypothetical protein